jgi:hypothetical protein
MPLEEKLFNYLNLCPFLSQTARAPSFARPSARRARARLLRRQPRQEFLVYRRQMGCFHAEKHRKIEHEHEHDGRSGLTLIVDCDWYSKGTAG